MPFIPGSQNECLCLEKLRHDETQAHEQHVIQEPTAPAHLQCTDSFPFLELHIYLAVRYVNVSATEKGKQVINWGPGWLLKEGSGMEGRVLACWGSRSISCIGLPHCQAANSIPRAMLGSGICSQSSSDASLMGGGWWYRWEKGQVMPGLG